MPGGQKSRALKPPNPRSRLPGYQGACCFFLFSSLCSILCHVTFSENLVSFGVAGSNRREKERKKKKIRKSWLRMFALLSTRNNCETVGRPGKRAASCCSVLN